MPKFWPIPDLKLTLLKVAWDEAFHILTTLTFVIALISPCAFVTDEPRGIVIQFRLFVPVILYKSIDLELVVTPPIVQLISTGPEPLMFTS